MSSKTKILIGVLLVGFLIGGWWVWEKQKLPQNNIFRPSKLCKTDSDCKYACGCGAINKDETCNVLAKCFADIQVKCAAGKCVEISRFVGNLTWKRLDNGAVFGIETDNAFYTISKDNVEQFLELNGSKIEAEGYLTEDKSFVFIRYKNMGNAPVDDKQNTCDSTPLDFKAKCNEINNWLDKKIAEWKPSTYKPMMFTVVDWPLQSVLVKSGSVDLDDIFLDAMLDLNPDAIYISILPQKYDTYKLRYDHAVQRIKEKNKILIISYNIAGKKEGDPTFLTPPTIEDYITKEKQYTEYYIKNYHPDYFVVVVEPVTENGRLESNWNANDWKRIIIETSEYAKTLNPKIKVGAILTIQDFGVFDAIKGMSSLDVVGFNIYGNYRIYDEYRDAKCSGDCVGKRLDEIKAIGKEPWILETWENSYYADPASFDAGWRKEINNKWIKVMTYYTQKHEAQNIMPFFTSKFVYEESPFDFKRIEVALKSGKRTPTFYAYKSVIEEVKNNTSAVLHN